MKVTRGELKQIINEELEAQILRENIISDLVDQIKDSGEDAADWVKKNAKKVAKAAASAGESVTDFADDVVQGALKGIDKTTGTRLSKRSKSIDRNKEARRAEKNAELKAQSDTWRAEDDAQSARATARQNAAEKLRQQNREWRAQDRKDNPNKYGPARGASERDPEVDPWGKKLGIAGTKTHRVSNRAGSGNMGYGESIDRDELKKAIKEELAKVLQGK